MSEEQGTILIAGALGMVGRAVLEQAEANDRTIIGLSRRTPDFETRARFINVDLRDRAAVEAKLTDLGDVTDLVYAAVWEKVNIGKGWTEPDHVVTNLAMLVNLVEVLEARAPKLKHITLMQGTKAYGIHMGPFRLPAREDDPRYMTPNFYYDQQDWLNAKSFGAPWGWTVFRPQLVCGYALGSPMNIVAGVGAYAAICRELGIPLRFPGGETRVIELTDSALLARAIDWAQDSPMAEDRVFNITNGDAFVWSHFWPRIAGHFAMPVDVPHPHSLVRSMADKEAVWARIVERHRLKPYKLSDLVPSWQFIDYSLGYGSRPNDVLLSTIRIRQAGFGDCVDSEEAFLGWLTRLQAERVLPR
ncbi:MAG: SDR family oxidoreductase [Pseudomonadota bacterium]|nr:SDR family oxidoreductase [Pseudomonadota bacterium]